MMSHKTKTSYDGSKKIWSGPENKFHFEGYSCLGQAIFKNLKNNPEIIFQISDIDGISLTNQEILTMSIRIAQRLEIEEGSILGIMATKSTYQACVVIAAFLRGIVLHPISSFYDEKTTQHAFGITRPKIVFCDADNYDVLTGALHNLNIHPKVYTIKGRIEGVECLHNLIEPTGTEHDFRPRECKLDDIAAIMLSSGTSGLPKGVCMSNRAFLNRIAPPLFSSSVIFGCSNIEWTSGLTCLLYSALCNVTGICNEEQNSPKMMRKLIEKYKINIIIMSASHMSRFVKSDEAELCDCSSLRIVVVSGESVSQLMFIKMQECLKKGIIYNSYGITEFGFIARSSSSEKPKSVGQIGTGIKVRIVDDYGNNLGIGETGEILVSHNYPWRGYYGNPIETQKIIDSEGWFHTGDIGLFDEDGDLHLIDRKKEILRYRGCQYSAQEIENCILALNDIAEVCVFGTMTDEFGDLATAAVIKKGGSKITKNDIKDHVKKRLSHQSKWLHGGVYFVENIPKTPSGKYQRFKIRELCLGNEIKSV